MHQHLGVEQEFPETSPPSEEFIRSITEQLILHSPTEDSSLLQENPFQEYYELWTLDTELLIPYPGDIHHPGAGSRMDILRIFRILQFSLDILTRGTTLKLFSFLLFLPEVFLHCH